MSGPGVLRPLVKWAGGKGGELPRIVPSMPDGFDRLLEPFVGGGAVLFATPPTVPAEANDMSPDLVSLYRHASAPGREFRDAVAAIDSAWTAVGRVDPTPGPDGDARTAIHAAAAAAPLAGIEATAPSAVADFAVAALRRKRATLDRLEASGEALRDRDGLLASALKAAVYSAVRSSYNGADPGPARTAMFWFLREFCYGGMFRTNSSGGFNVPYGGMSYDDRTMASRVAQLDCPAMRERLGATRFHQGDFEAFLKAASPRPGDLVFLDPPYDSPFSTYDGSGFSRVDHARLASAMARLPCDWMIVISETPFVRETYCSLPGARVQAFAKGYAANIKQRFERKVTHLMVTNYARAQLPAAVAA